jgi:hypothetical protein
VRSLVVALLSALALSGCTIYTAPAHGPAYAGGRGYAPVRGDCECRCRHEAPAAQDDYAMAPEGAEAEPVDPYQRSYPRSYPRSRFGDRPEDWLE